MHTFTVIEHLRMGVSIYVLQLLFQAIFALFLVLLRVEFNVDDDYYFCKHFNAK